MARTIRKAGVKEVPLSEIKDDLSRFLREAETQEIVITRHGKPAGLLVGFESEEDSSTVLSMTRASCVVSSEHGAACARDAGPDWRIAEILLFFAQRLAARPIAA